MNVWAFLGIAVTGFAIWFVTTDVTPPQPWLPLIVIPVFVVPPLGTFWMMYMGVRYERRPMRYVLLAGIPFQQPGYAG
jgi:hypothetical protein